MKPDTRALLLIHGALFLTAVLWGGNFTALKYLLERVEPIDALILRVGGAALFFGVILLLDRRARHRIARVDLLRFLGLGVLGITVMNLGFVYGQSLIPAALASLVVTSNPIWTAIISRFIGGEPLTSRKIGGIALAMLGFLIVLFLGSGDGAGLGGAQIKGMLLCAIAPFSWAFYTVLSKPLLRTYQPTETAAYTSIGGALGLIPFAFFDRGMTDRLQELNGMGWLAALYLTALGFVLAYILWYQGLRALSASQAAVYIYLVPVFGLLCAWLILDEAVTRYLVLGAAVILSGVILTNTAKKSSSRGAEQPSSEGAETGRRGGAELPSMSSSET
jgi:drug/metabolite transporter (DMT)-like permease